MKKLSITLALVLTLGAGVAFASSLAIPWFVDNSPAGSGWPPTSRNTTLVYLKNNTEDDITAEIEYFAPDGTPLGPAAPANTFVLPAKATTYFRPAIDDPVGSLPGGLPGGQENAVALAVPNRPITTEQPQKNGSITISWVGGPNDIQGMVATAGPNISYAHLLPPGN